MNRCECGHPVFGRSRSSDCNRAFCPLQRRFVFDAAAAGVWVARALVGIGIPVFLVWAIWRCVTWG